MFVRAIVFLLGVWVFPAQANLDTLTNQDATSGLRAALEGLQ